MIVASALALALAAIFFSLFVRDKDVPEPIPVSPVQHLDDRKQAIYENLRDLQFEYRLGKLTDGDYQQTKQALQKELAGVLSEKERILKSLGVSDPVQAAAVPVKASGTVCPHCGASFNENLKFCGQCGKAIA